MEAISNYPYAIKYASNELKNNYDLDLKAVKYKFLIFLLLKMRNDFSIIHLSYISLLMN